MLPRLTSQSTDLVLKTAADGTQVTLPAPKPEVIEEDKYVEALDKIIKRDFFPDLEKLDNQLEWLEAVRKNDVKKMLEIKARYANRGCSTPRPFATPNFSLTPALPSGSETPGSTPKRRKLSETEVEEPKDPVEKDAERLRLDAFVTKYTSEDNASFAQIMESNAKANENKLWWLHDPKEGDPQYEKHQLLIAPPPEKGGVVTWKYETRNSLMYTPEGRPRVLDVDTAKQAEKEVLISNTRLQGSLPWEEAKRAKEVAERERLRKQQTESHATYLPTTDPAMYIFERKRAAANAKVDLDDLRGTPRVGADVPQSPRVAGYGFVTTPSPVPGADVDPIMTWGEIQGTPLLLDPTDTPIDVASHDGPTFKVPELTAREQAALALANKASRNLKPGSVHPKSSTPLRSPLNRRATPSPLMSLLRRSTPSPLIKSKAKPTDFSEKMRSMRVVTPDV